MEAKTNLPCFFLPEFRLDTKIWASAGIQTLTHVYFSSFSDIWRPTVSTQTPLLSILRSGGVTEF